METSKVSPDFACRNNPDREKTKDAGPLPWGGYNIGPQKSNYSRRALSPFPSNDMHERGDFQIHGCKDPKTCSQGCIGATTNAVRDQFNRLMSLEEGNNTLIVIPGNNISYQ